MNPHLETAIDAIQALNLMIGNSLTNHALKAYALQELHKVKEDIEKQAPPKT